MHTIFKVTCRSLGTFHYLAYLMPYPSPPFAHLSLSVGLPRWRSGKESACQCRRHRRHGFNPWVGTSPWRREWQPTPVFLTGKSHGQKSLAGYSPRCRKRWDMTEHDMHAPVLQVTVQGGLIHTEGHRADSSEPSRHFVCTKAL